MNETELDEYRVLIRQWLDELIKEFAFSARAQQVVEFDQQPVGHISRMDALQIQAISQVQRGRLHGQRKAVLSRRMNCACGKFAG